MKILITSEWRDIVDQSLTLGTTSITLLLTLYISWRHCSTRGIDPEWKSHILPLPLLFFLYSLSGTLSLYFRETRHYLEGVNGIYQALMVRELFLLLLYLFNRQADFHFPQETTYTLLHKNKCSFNQDALRGKIEYYFLKCPPLFSGRLSPSHRLLSILETFVLFSLLVRLLLTLLSFLFLHREEFREFFYLVQASDFLLSLLALGSLFLLILFLEGVIWMFQPRLKWSILFLPSLLLPLQSLLFSLEFSAFLTGLESLFLLLSLLWIYPFSEHELTSLITRKS